MSTTTLKPYYDEHARAVTELRSFVDGITERGEQPNAEESTRIEFLIERCDEARKRRDQMEQVEERTVQQEKEAVAYDEAKAELRSEGREGEIAPEPDFREMCRLGLSEGRTTHTDIDLASAVRARNLIRDGASGSDLVAVARAQRVTAQQARMAMLTGNSVEKRTLNIGTDTAGGYTVPTQTASRIIDYMEDIGGVVRAGAEVMVTGSGETINIPTNAGHVAVTGTLETGEGAAIAATEDSLGQVTAKSYKYTGGTDITHELIQDTIADLDGFVSRMLGRVIGKKTETRFTLGTGSSMPKGVCHSPPAAQTVTGATSHQIAKSELYDMRFKLDAGYLSSNRLRWMMPPATYAHILQIEVGTVESGQSRDQRPLFAPSYIVGEPDQILGSPVSYNGFMQALTVDNAITMAYGDFYDGYLVRLVNNMRIESSPHAEFKKQMVAFIASLRADGQVKDDRAIIRYKVKA